MFNLSFLFLYLFLKSRKWTAGEYVTDSWGILCNFDIPGLDSSPLPVFLGGDRKIDPNFCPEFDDALIWCVVVTKQFNT